MVKLEWGMKRVCQGCSARFYDLRKTPIVCPKCGEIYETAATTHRGRKAVAEDDKAMMLPIDEVGIIDDIDIADDLGETSPDDDLIEDTSDLGEDLDDMSEMIDHDEEIEER